MFLDIIIFLIKLIGWLLLILLGLIVVVLLTVLLIPVRYRLRLTHGEAFHLDSTVSWLLHIVHARITQEGEQRRIIVRVFGIIIYDSTKPAKRKKHRQGIGNNHRKRTRRTLLKRVKKRRNAKPIPSERIPDGTGEGRSVQKIEESEDKPVEDIKDSIYNKNGDKKEDNLDDIIKDTIEDTIEETIEDPIEEEINNTIEDPIEDEIDKTLEDTAEETGNLLVRFIKKVRAKFKGIRHFFHRMAKRIKGWFQKTLDLKHKINLIKAFINEEENRAAFGLTYTKLKLLIKHILPTKLRSQLIFGTGDPCSTGQALGVFAVLFGVYGEYVQITPDFENKIFKGSHYAKGRIRIGTLLIIVIKLLLDKKFKQLLRNYRILKEAL